MDVTKRDKEVTRLYKCTELPLNKIGKRYGISKQRVYQIIQANTDFRRDRRKKPHYSTYKKADEVLNFIIKYKQENDGLSPSTRTISKHIFGYWRVNPIYRFLSILEENGYIEIINRMSGGVDIKVVGGSWTYKGSVE